MLLKSLLLVNLIGSLDFSGSFLVLFLKEYVLRPQVLDSGFKLALMLLHLNVELLSLSGMHFF